MKMSWMVVGCLLEVVERRRLGCSPGGIAGVMM